MRMTMSLKSLYLLILSLRVTMRSIDWSIINPTGLKSSMFSGIFSRFFVFFSSILNTFSYWCLCSLKRESKIHVVCEHRWVQCVDNWLCLSTYVSTTCACGCFELLAPLTCWEGGLTGAKISRTPSPLSSVVVFKFKSQVSLPFQCVRFPFPSSHWHGREMTIL